LGYSSLTESEVNAAFIRFKELADKKKEISNLDLESIINDEIQMIAKNRYKLTHVQVNSGDKSIPTATLSIFDEEAGQEATISMIGTGPVDAAYKGIVELTHAGMNGNSVKLLEYLVSSVTGGIDALAEVTVRLQDVNSGRLSTGRSANTDVIVASVQAYLNAINKCIQARGSELPTHPQFSTSIV